MPYCSHCGSPLDEGSQFCPYCGANQNDAPRQSMYQSGMPLPPRKSNTGLIIALIAVIAVVAIGVVSYVFVFKNNPKPQTEPAAPIRDTIVIQKEVKQVPVETQKLPTHTDKVNTYPAADPRPQGTYYLSGKVGKYPVKMSLTIDGNDITGFYYYERSGSGASMDIYGEAHGQKISVFEVEQTNGCTGAFDGKFDGNRFVGTFVNYKGQVFKMTLQAE